MSQGRRRIEAPCGKAEDRGAAEVTASHIKVPRPWGSYQSSDIGDRHQLSSSRASGYHCKNIITAPTKSLNSAMGRQPSSITRFHNVRLSGVSDARIRK